VFNISAMSFGALSANAILALNAGARRGGFMHDTGEGSVSRYHREHGGDLVWEMASGYFGCRDEAGRFARTSSRPWRRPADQADRGEALPGRQARPRRRAARPQGDGRDRRGARRAGGRGLRLARGHSAFGTPEELLQFVARLRELSGGKPTGFKLCIGHPWEWFAICKAMLATGITPDFIVVDGGEGGTGAAPLEFTDHVGAPLQEGLLLVHNTLVGLNLRDKIRIGAAGRIVSAFDIARAMAWAPTGATRPAASCSRWAASRPRPATPASAPPASPPRTRCASRPWWCRTRPSGSSTSTRTRCMRCRSWCRPPACSTRARSPPATSCAARRATG
jgi:glutamate synthase domain-containing protein 2